LKGKISAVRIEGGRIVTYFGDGEKSAAATTKRTNYILLQGNAFRFGKLTMTNADLTIEDLDPADPLDWYQDHYQEQLAAGYARITGNYGLLAYAKDYGKLRRGSSAVPKRKADSTGLAEKD
jgi:hypothetical protein